MPITIPPTLRRRIDPEHATRIIAALAPLQHGAEIAAPPQKMLLLCFSNRCGSNFLAALLASTGAFNEAGEFFNAETVLAHAASLPAPSLRAYLAHLPTLIGATDWLAAKASIDQLMMLTDAGWLEEMRGRSHFLLLERRNRLDQAISRSIAAQNRQWTSGHATMLPDYLLAYSREAIDAELFRIDLANAGFYAFFAANGLTPIHVSYEALVAAPEATIGDIGRRLGMDGLVPDLARVSITRQTRGINREWRGRYLRGE